MMELLGKVVTSLAGNPWALLVLVAIVGIGYLIHLLIKNNKITDAIANRISGEEITAEIAKVIDEKVGNTKELDAKLSTLTVIVEDIRKDQKESNRLREEQAESIKRISARLSLVEEAIIALPDNKDIVAKIQKNKDAA